MGWKNVKEHYRIEHIVHIKDEWHEFERCKTGNKLLCIGSPLCHDLITVNLTTRKFEDKLSARSRGGELQRYWDEMQADVDKLFSLIEVPDTFERSIPVFTFEDGDILEKRCEELDWPNVTHDGDIMNNRFHETRAAAVEHAISNAEAGIENITQCIAERERETEKMRDRLSQYKSNLEKLKSDGKIQTA